MASANSKQQAAAVGGASASPAREGRRGRIDGAVDVGCPRFGDLGDHRAVVRVDDLDGCAVDSVDELAADEELVAHQKSTGYTLALPVRISSGSSGEAFSHTSSIDRLAL